MEVNPSIPKEPPIPAVTLSRKLDPSIQFLEATKEIASTIEKHASRARDGNIFWRHPVHSVGAFRPSLIGPHLYPGTTGIAFFFAAAKYVLGDDDFRALALQAILPLRREIQEIAGDPLREQALRHPIGGLTGLGSLVYGLTRIGDLLGDSSLFEDAKAVSSLITPKRIADDKNLDVMLGAAGAILGLLALEERLPGETLNGVPLLELAICCARHLAAQRSFLPTGPVWQASPGDALPSGFCHGMAGVACALARLSKRVGDSAWQEIAEQSLEQERALYVPDQKNWKLTESGEHRFFNSWCKGAPGIALGRLAMRKVRSSLLFDAEISNALATTAALPISTTDDLCCGNAGRVDILVQASLELDDPAWLCDALRIADALLDRARRNGYYSLKLNGEVILDLRLFSGLAGIGYSFLRLASTDRLPWCVLAME